MDEYIKREDAIKAITWNGLSEPPEIIHLTLLTAQKNIRRISAADVAPKSEVERVYYNLQAVLEERAETKQEIAREIFEEIDIQLAFLKRYGNVSKTTDLIFNILAELKKKYTEEKK